MYINELSNLYKITTIYVCTIVKLFIIKLNKSPVVHLNTLEVVSMTSYIYVDKTRFANTSEDDDNTIT